MDVTQTPLMTPAAAKTTSVAETEKPKDATAEAAGMAGDFETFLTLLTTQLKNQDPLKPMESTEFVSQLASFSAVEQQVRANDRLDRIVEVLSGGTTDGLAAWIGKEVRAPAKGAYSGVPIEVEVTPAEDADSAVLIVKNDFGTEVARKVVAADAELVTWDGTDNTGNALPHGRYGFELASFEGETPLSTQTGKVYATVTEVRLKDGEPVLVTDGGGQVPLSEISALR